MKPLTKIPDKGDPSNILQVFSKLNLSLLCCRYWWLEHWEFHELSFPYWRIYSNNKEGAVISYQNQEYQMTHDKILMIAPNTSFSTRFTGQSMPKEGYVLKGGRVGEMKSAQKLIDEGYLLHLFIHFKLGTPYDNIQPGIFEFNLSPHLKEKVALITNYLNSNYTNFDFQSVITIQSLIADLLMEVPNREWKLISKDYRILDSLNLIESNLDTKLSNSVLASKAQMATNAFNRLFVQEIGVSPQRFVKQKRIDKACELLHYSKNSIETIAEVCGFSDRYHFSRIFKQCTQISPARYRKEFVL